MRSSTPLLRSPSLPLLLLQTRPLSASLLPPPPPPPPIPSSTLDPALLLRLCTVLHQHRNASDARLHASLRALPLPSPLPHALFLELCNRFPYSWKPLHSFLLFAAASLRFSHTYVTAAKLLSVFGRAKNTDLLWDSFCAFASQRLLSAAALRAAARAMAEAREIKKCAAVVTLASDHDPELHGVGSLNSVVEELCARKLVDVARAVVWRLRACVPPDETTYGLLVVGFCRAGELAAAARVWNRLVAEGLEPNASSYEEIVVTLFKNNRLEDAMAMFKSMRARRFVDMELISYRTVIQWMCKEGRILYAYMLLAEMIKRGVGVDNQTLGSLVYGLLVRRRVREGYKVLDLVLKPDISLYHGLIKGLLRLRRAGEATQVFQEMVRRGVEPIMHTYVMLLQGHLGKRGRKARDPEVNFDNVFVGGLVKAGRMLAATKYVERMIWGGVNVPRFDYNKFLHEFSNEDGVVMFEEVGKRLKEAGMVDLGDIFLRYGEKMATRDRRRRVPAGCLDTCQLKDP